MTNQNAPLEAHDLQSWEEFLAGMVICHLLIIIGFGGLAIVVTSSSP